MVSPGTVARFLNTNEIPTALEAATLQAEIDELLAQISQLEGKVRQRRGALSAVRRLPDEILGEIFLSALLPTPPNSHYRRHLIHFNLVCKDWRRAALMCHQLWSHVRFESGDRLSFLPIRSWMARSGVLPKKLEVYVPLRTTRTSEQDEEEEESGDLEEEEEEEEEGEEGEEDEGEEQREEEEDEGEGERKDIGDPEDVVVQLLVHGVPLDNLGLKFHGGPEDLQDLLDSLGEPDPSSEPRPWDCITTLSLSFGDEQWDEPNAMESLLLRLPATITSLDLRIPDSYIVLPAGPMYDEPMLWFPEAFAKNLTSLSVTCTWGIQHVFSMLEHCANLEVLTLTLQTGWEGGWEVDYLEWLDVRSPIPQIKLPKVHTLRLRQSSPEAVSYLRFMEAPLLANLDFEFTNSEWYYGLPFDAGLWIFLTTGSKCGARLTSLRLTGIRINAKRFCLILAKLPALACLKLEDVSFDEGDHLFRRLRKRFTSTSSAAKGSPQPTPFLSKLRVLELIDRYDDDMINEDSEHDLIRFLGAWCSRSTDSGGQKELTVGYHDQKHFSPLQYSSAYNSHILKSLKRNGTRVNIFQT